MVADSSNGRTSYTNAGKIRRRGLELSMDQQFADDIQLRLAWTLLDVTYRTRACGSSDCSEGDAIADGNRLPGIALNMGYASLAWSPPEGWYAAWKCVT